MIPHSLIALCQKRYGPSSVLHSYDVSNIKYTRKTAVLGYLFEQKYKAPAAITLSMVGLCDGAIWTPSHNLYMAETGNFKNVL